MSPQLAEIALNLACAWIAGSLIGLERSYNGRAAGFRTHALVGLSSGSVMSIAAHPGLMLGFYAAIPVGIDPTPQLAQGIMTGVGFLGAGVIFKEGANVQGLTTAACIWATAAIGILFGRDQFWPGVMTTAAVLITLIVFRWLEDTIPWRIYTLATFRFQTGAAPNETELRLLLGEHDVEFSDTSYRLADGGETIEFRGLLRSSRAAAIASLAVRLRDAPGLKEYELTRISK
ncbi:MAG: MgtC/SapB family protein [Caulobacteraceae bacterium]|nr:MgtC/SapB family protein [Caulobacteraceae bacterium]